MITLDFLSQPTKAGVRILFSAGLANASGNCKVSFKRLLVLLILGILAGTPNWASVEPQSPGSLNSFALANGEGTDPYANVSVLPDKRILFGEAFQRLSVGKKNRLERLNSDGGLNTSFPFSREKPNNYTVILAEYFHVKILGGGSFTNYRGVRRAGLARFNPARRPFPTKLRPGHRDSTSILPRQRFLALAKLCRYGCPPPHRDS